MSGLGLGNAVGTTRSAAPTQPVAERSASNPTGQVASQPGTHGAASTSTPAASQLDVAIPFIVTIGLLIVGAGVAALVRQRFESVYSGWLSSQGINEKKLIYVQRPAAIADMSMWIIDASQALSVVVVPIVGLALLHGTLEQFVTVLYVVMALAGFLTLVWFLTTKRPEAYARRRWLMVTPLTVVGVGVNVIAGVAAFAFTD